jgi:hypothetical protein
MKRRGFLGLLFGAPAVPVAAAMLEKLPKGFTRGLVENEPEVISVRAAREIGGPETWVSAVVEPISYDEFMRRHHE